MASYSKFVAIGSYLPDKILTNDDLSKIVDTSDEWIVKRTGIKERRIAEAETNANLASNAALDLINNYNIDKNTIDMIIVATSTAEEAFPAIANYVSKNLELQKNVPCFDMQQACCGLLYAITVADGLLASRNFNRILVIGSDKMSSIVDWKDRNTCVLFGDGASAILLDRIETEAEKSILDYKIYSDSSCVDILRCDRRHIEMDGQAVFKNATIRLTEVISEILERNKISIEQVQAIIPHQANYRIIDAVANRLSIPAEKFVLTLEKQGNTSAASVGLALHHAIKSGRVKAGDLIILEAVGAGMSWGACLMKI